ncbi:HAD-IA family hydrolase [Breznakiella homolactica]|uniref:HAD-IA family hydrolase n=1 Tax=Breznakiella homolactica TaxID=2798577 RepID=A0A7T8B9J8_9SPIR|nr:HAD-IA family hydrolase [Breznakiella homolactica]QQO08537.1 HAD-IA family hydrolase [Breznakiella homolactica]
MIKHILFDLDSTLYSKNLNVESGVDQRITQFIADYLSVSLEEAQKQRSLNVPKNYGLSTQWLIKEKGFRDIDYFYSVIHPEDECKNLKYDPELRSFIESLPVPCGILTNSPMVHASRVLQALGIADLFPVVVDIRQNNLVGKPDEGAYRKALTALDAEPETTLFIDDAPHYVEGFLKIRGQGVLIDEFNDHPDWPHEKIQKLEEIRRFL